MEYKHVQRAQEPFDAAVIGAGPAGSAAALFLRSTGYSVCLIEKRTFPRETVCGEFLSNEVTKGLRELGVFTEFLRHAPNPITSVQMHTERGRTIEGDLGFIAYGMKRGTFDHFLMDEARKRGVCIKQPAEVDGIVRCGVHFLVRFRNGTARDEVSARHVIAAYGKQNILDKQFQRRSIGSRSGLNGVKFHLERRQCPGVSQNSIHLFPGPHLYCGVNCVDEGKVTVCFLEDRTAGGVGARERLIRFASGNELFRSIFDRSFDTLCATVPLYGAGNIYFGPKEAVCDGIYMAGDAAGMIAPLTGDGIGMAFEGARLIAEVFDAQRERSLDARATEDLYRRRRSELFDRRLRIARQFQTVLLSPALSAAGFSLLRVMPALLPKFVSITRGSSAGSSSDPE